MYINFLLKKKVDEHKFSIEKKQAHSDHEFNLEICRSIGLSQNVSHYFYIQYIPLRDSFTA